MAPDNRPIFLMMLDDIKLDIARGESSYNIGIGVLCTLVVGGFLTIVTAPLWILATLSGRLAKWWFAEAK